jgi:hypothetical protein
MGTTKLDVDVMLGSDGKVERSLQKWEVAGRRVSRIIGRLAKVLFAQDSVSEAPALKDMIIGVLMNTEIRVP